jgi:thiamine-monophosphate kinase
MNEDQLIPLLTRAWKNNSRVRAGVGDDCAVIQDCHPRHCLLLKTDAIVEGRHFTRQTPPQLIGRKALARVLSDFAAMGGTPQYALVTLGLPSSYPTARIQKIYAGLTRLAERYKVNLVGGETTRTLELILSISALGETRGHAPILRSGAKAGDHLYVTGNLGKTQTRKHLHFIPRLAEGHWLAQHKIASAMMDLSDGLGTDLPRLARQSKVGYTVETAHLPLTRGATWQQACSDGEDYELLFTVPSKKDGILRRTWPFRTKLTRIGQITRLGLTSTSQRDLPHGFDHLQHA